MITKPDIAVTLSAGQSVSFAPDPRFALKGEWTAVFIVSPGWSPAAGAKADWGPPLLQFGDEDNPGRILAVRISQDLKSFIVSSEVTKPQTFRYGNSQVGANLVYCINLISFSGGEIRVPYGSRWEDAAPVEFAPGKPTAAAPQLTLGGADENGKYPFSGAIGCVMLFDRDILDDLMKNLVNSNPVALWTTGRPDEFLSRLTGPSQGIVSTALVGVGLPGQKRFEFLPREILWPDPEPKRWMLKSGNLPPVGVILPGQAEDAVPTTWTTNNVYCFTRIRGELYLWSDGGQTFKLKYAGQNQFTGDSDQLKVTIALDYRPAPPGHHDTIAVTPVGGWDNTDKRVFVTTPFPAGGTIEELVDGPADAASRRQREQLVWPHAPELFRLFDSFLEENPGLDQPTIEFTNKFAEIMKTLMYSMRGWDLTRVSDPLNPTKNFSSEHDPAYLLFKPPAGTGYRAIDDMPYCIYRKHLGAGQGSGSNQVFRSMEECSSELSRSIGFGVNKGESSLLSASFSDVAAKSQAISREHSVALQYHSDLAFACVLEKQWMRLTARFIEELLDAIGSHYLSGPAGADGHSPPPTIASDAAARDPHRFDKLHQFFQSWGTHYPNAITYGSTTYNLSLIDEAGLEDMASATKEQSGGIGVPLEGLVASLKVSEKEGKAHQLDTGNRIEVYLENSTGRDVPAPILLDLRPIWELIQPPYINGSEVKGKFPYVDDIMMSLPHIKTGFTQYLDMHRRSAPPGGPVLYQARLLSLQNVGTDPCYVSARAFLAGASTRAGGGIAVPAASDRRSPSIRVWCENHFRVDGGQTCNVPLATPPAALYAKLAVPSSMMDDVYVAIYLTGVAVVAKEAAIRQAEYHTEFKSVGGEGMGEYKIPPTPEELRRAEDAEAGPYTVDTLGCDLRPWPSGAATTIVGAKSIVAEVGAILKLSALPPDGTFNTFSTRFAGIVATFEARKIDLQGAWEKLKNSGGAPAV